MAWQQHKGHLKHKGQEIADVLFCWAVLRSPAKSLTCGLNNTEPQPRIHLKTTTNTALLPPNPLKTTTNTALLPPNPLKPTKKDPRTKPSDFKTRLPPRLSPHLAEHPEGGLPLPRPLARGDGLSRGELALAGRSGELVAPKFLRLRHIGKRNPSAALASFLLTANRAPCSSSKGRPANRTFLGPSVDSTGYAQSMGPQNCP